MRERFSKIFEFWNQRNVGFYKECFKKLETENKTSFNYIAGMFPIMWMIFRKMYGWAMLFAFILPRIETALKTLVPGIITSILFSVVTFLVFGFIGNTLYYRHVKSKVAKGYAEVEGYNSIGPGGCVFYMLCSGFLMMLIIWLSAVNHYPVKGIYLADMFVTVFVIAILWAIDCKKCRSQEVVGTVSVNEESVGKYLEKADSKNMFTAICGLLSFPFICIVLIAGLKVLGLRILDQLKVEHLDGARPLKDVLEEELRKASKESYVEDFEEARQDSEVQNNADHSINLNDEIDKTQNDSNNSGIFEEENTEEVES